MSTLPAGTVFAQRFVIVRLAAQGGMGDVYRAHDMLRGGLVALKRLSSGAVTENERFKRESQLLAELHHPGIVQYIDSGRTPEGEPYLVMEWLEGEDLAQRLSHRDLSLSETLAMLLSVSDALSDAHSHGILHRDLKPSNLFLRDGDAGRPVILDFGIAKQKTAVVRLTKTGAVLGTPAYMAPEQARGERDLTAAVDLFALGCVLYECLAGQPPFVGEHLPAVLTQILFSEPPALASLQPTLPPFVCALVERLLSKDPARRPPSALALRNELRLLLSSHPEAATDARAEQRAGEGAAPRADDAPGAERDSVPDQTLPWLPFIGRDRELVLLVQACDTCFEERRASALLVTASAGMGKSRLRYEFLRGLAERHPECLVLHGRGEALASGTPYAVLAQALRRLCGIQAGEENSLRRQKLRQRLGRALPSHESQRILEFMGELCSISYADAASPPLRAAHQNPALMAEQLTQSFCDYLQAECERQPVLVVIEDAHLADQMSSRVLGQALRDLRDQPLFVLALARPEIDERLPGLWVERGVVRLPLPALGKRASEKLVQHALASAGQPGEAGETAARIVEQSGGNALFLEELVRAVLAGRGEALPQTVLSILEERIAALPAGVGHLLRAASVFGDAFFLGGVRAVLGQTTTETVLRSWLLLCEEKDLIDPRRKGRFVGEPEYRFRHALMREAAYAGLSDEAKRAAHGCAGDWLERMRESDAMVLAEHFLRGGQPERAAVWLYRATADALDANDLHLVHERAERAAATGVGGSLLGRVRRLQATAAFWLSEYAAARSYAEQSIPLLPVGSAEWFLAVGEAVASCGRLGDAEGVLAHFERANLATAESSARAARVICLSRAAFPLIQLGQLARVAPIIEHLAAESEGLGESEALARAQACQVMAEYAHHQGDLEGAVRRLERATEAFVQAGDARSALSESNSMAASYVELGRVAEAEAICRRNLALGERYNTPRATAFARFVLAYALVYRPQGAAEQRQLAESLVSEYRAARSLRMQGISQLLVAIAELHLEQPVAAEVAAREAVELLAAYPGMRSWALAIHARVLLALGQTEQALEQARAAHQLLTERGVLERGQGWPPIVLVEALLAAQQPDAARRALVDARHRLDERARRIQDPQTRAQFLKLWPHARTLELAATLLP